MLLDRQATTGMPGTVPIRVSTPPNIVMLAMSTVASTLVTNPVTFAPVYLAAHRLGSALLGKPAA